MTKREKKKVLSQLHKDLAALEAAGVPGAAEDRRKVWKELMKLEGH